MSIPSPYNTITLKSDGVAAIPTFSAVTLDAAAALGLPAASTTAIVGIVQDGGGVALGDTATPVPVAVAGISYAIAGGVIAAAPGVTLLMPDAGNGRLIPFVAAAGNYACAEFLPDENQPSAADGDIIRVNIISNPVTT